VPNNEVTLHLARLVPGWKTDSDRHNAFCNETCKMHKLATNFNFYRFDDIS